MPEQVPIPEILYFKNAEAAFEYSCKYSFAEVKDGQPRVAVIEKLSVQDQKGFQNALLRVAGRDDSFNVIASTAAPMVPTLKAGELVLWMPMQIGSVPVSAADRRTAWLGLIVGVLAPELIMATQNYRMEIDYRNLCARKQNQKVRRQSLSRRHSLQTLKEFNS